MLLYISSFKRFKFVTIFNPQFEKMGGLHGSDNHLYPMANRINKAAKVGQ